MRWWSAFFIITHVAGGHGYVPAKYYIKNIRQRDDE
jgi:hypothetical protein